MNVCRKLERTLYMCPETEPEQYGIISKDILNSFLMMGTEYKGPVMFGFLRTNSLGEQYFDIYVVDSDKPNGYARLIIQNGKRMSAEMEDLLNYYCLDKKTTIDHSLVTLISSVSKKLYPNIHMKEYAENEKMMLNHLYYSFQDGPRELLFKSGLGYIGTYLDDIDEVNLEGSTPSKILNGIPLRFLRVLDCPEGVNLLAQVEHRDVLAQYASDICRNYTFIPNMNECQARYLFDVVENDREYVKDVFFYLHHFNTTEQLYDYYRYLQQKTEISKYKKFPLIPEFKYLHNYETEVDRIWNVAIGKRELYEEPFRRNKEYLDGKYGYKDEFIHVKAPTLDEFIMEAVSQNNCLLSNYLDSHCSGNCSIMLVRKLSEPNKSYITMEIRRELVATALKKNNSELEMEEAELIKTFATAKNLEYSSFPTLFLEEGWDDDIFDE